jgi:hypothetical protein
MIFDRKIWFVLTILVSEGCACFRTDARAAVPGRYVRFELPERTRVGPDERTMSFFEIEIYSGAENIALRGIASQSPPSSVGRARFSDRC